MKSAGQAIYEIQQGKLTSEAYVAQCAAAVEQHEPRVQALAYYDAEAAMAAARRADQAPWKGMLHGIPVIVKDVFDTQDLPTTFNSPLYEGAQPAKDAAIANPTAWPCATSDRLDRLNPHIPDLPSDEML